MAREWFGTRLEAICAAAVHARGAVTELDACNRRLRVNLSAPNQRMQPTRPAAPGGGVSDLSTHRVVAGG